MKRVLPIVHLICLLAAIANAEQIERHDYRVLATSKTSTMEKEMNDAADAGYSFQSVMGGETAFGGNEVVVVMGKGREARAGNKRYLLLATKKTSTMEKEMQRAADEGFDYKGQTVFNSKFGGREVSVIMERDKNQPVRQFEYRLLATSKTGTMQKELLEAGDEGFELVGMTVGQTSFGGSELVCITRRLLDQ